MRCCRTKGHFENIRSFDLSKSICLQFVNFVVSGQVAWRKVCTIGATIC